MKKRVLSSVLLFSAVLFFLSVRIQAQPLFSDVKGHPCQAVIQKWQASGIIQGYNGRFRPDDRITRAEFAVLLNRLVGYSPQAGIRFRDITSEHWYTHDMLSLASAKILSDMDGKAEPDKPILQSQARQMLDKALSIETKTTIEDNSHYITRAETIQLLDQMVSQVYHKKGEYTGIIHGNVIVRTKDISLKNMEINGNLYIMEGVNDGDVDLDHVKINGKLFVRGGGKNSIHINNCEINELVSTKDKVRIVLANGTTITFLRSQLKDGILELGDSKVKNLTILGDGMQIKLSGLSTITALNIEANQVNIAGAKTSLIHQANLKGQANITGQLTINQALITKNGSHLENPPLEYQLGYGVSVQIGDNVTTVSKTNEPDSADSSYTPLPSWEEEVLLTHSIADKSNIPYKTGFEDLNLPAEALFTSNKSNRLTVNLAWKKNDYDPLTIGRQSIKAKVSAASGILPHWVPAEIQIAVTVIAPPLPQTLKVRDYAAGEIDALNLYRGINSNYILQIYNQNNTKMSYATLKEMNAQLKVEEIEGVTANIKVPANEQDDILLLIQVPADYVPSEFQLNITCNYDFLGGGTLTKSIPVHVANAPLTLYPPTIFAVHTDDIAAGEAAKGRLYISYTEPEDLTGLKYYRCGFKEMGTEREFPLSFVFLPLVAGETAYQDFDPDVQSFSGELDPTKDYHLALNAIGKKPDTTAGVTDTSKQFRFQEDTDFQNIIFEKSTWSLNMESNHVYLWLESLDYHYEGQAQLPEKECFFIDVRYKDSHFYGDYAFFENGRLTESQPLILKGSEEMDFSDPAAFEISFRRVHPLQKIDDDPDTYLYRYSHERFIPSENCEIQIP